MNAYKDVERRSQTREGCKYAIQHNDKKRCCCQAYLKFLFSISQCCHEPYRGNAGLLLSRFGGRFLRRFTPFPTRPFWKRKERAENELIRFKIRGFSLGRIRRKASGRINIVYYTWFLIMQKWEAGSFHHFIYSHMLHQSSVCAVNG